MQQQQQHAVNSNEEQSDVITTTAQQASWQKVNRIAFDMNGIRSSNKNKPSLYGKKHANLK